MKDAPLHSYLNDHLAGSVAALELLEHLQAEAPAEARPFLTTLREEIADDRRALQSLLHDLHGEESRLREAGAWLMQKVGELKLRVGEFAGKELRYFQALETLALGIQGKLALWTALEAVRDRVAQLETIDLPSLKERARDQHARVEARRVAAAREAIGGAVSSFSSPSR